MEELEFYEENDEAPINGYWDILIVDDEKEVHIITQTVLQELIFDDKSIRFHHAFNSKEAIEIMKTHDTIALVLLDVVMEKQNAGLMVVKTIRNELCNRLVRIILRTGQPGQAPQKEVILQYDINDYKEKTELTSTKLYSTVITALRSYKELLMRQNNKLSLEHIIKSSHALYEQKTISSMVERFSQNLYDLLCINNEAIKATQCVTIFKYKSNQIKRIRTMGCHLDVDDLVLRSIEQENEYLIDGDHCIKNIKVDDHYYYSIHINNYAQFDEFKRDEILIFLSHTMTLFQNFFLQKQRVEDILEMTKKDQLIQQQARSVQMADIISMIAHHWRQPLHIISLKIMNMEVKLSLWKEKDHDLTLEEQYELIHDELRKVSDQLNALSCVIDNFSNFYQPKQKKETNTITEPIQKALEIIQPSLDEKSISVDVMYGSNSRTTMFTHELIQVILSILKNAQENFERKRTPEPTITIKTYEQDHKMRINISDNGGGIEKSIQYKVFDPYFSTKKEKNGTGLGLYIAKLVIEEHHLGRICYKNLKHGACIMIDLPM